MSIKRYCASNPQANNHEKNLHAPNRQITMLELTNPFQKSCGHEGARGYQAGACFTQYFCIATRTSQTPFQPAGMQKESPALNTSSAPSALSAISPSRRITNSSALLSCSQLPGSQC